MEAAVTRNAPSEPDGQSRSSLSSPPGPVEAIGSPVREEVYAYRAYRARLEADAKATSAEDDEALWPAWHAFVGLDDGEGA